MSPTNEDRSETAGRTHAATGPDLTASLPEIAQRDWSAIAADLDASGWSVLTNLLGQASCDAITRLYDGEGFRRQVVMARHGYGEGEYRYFSYPLPPIVQALRSGLYSHLAPIANLWHERLGVDARFAVDHDAFLARCRAHGQARPTPLLLKYGPGDYNRLHQDLYGDQVFPLQVAVLLADPGKDFEGGEFVLTEHRPRLQTQATVVPLAKGDAVVFAVNSRPVSASRGPVRVAMRHGVSRVRSGHRHTLGIVFHDAA